MPWVTPATITTGTLVTAARWNQDVVDNVIALRGGATAMTNQAAGRFFVSSSSTQVSVNKNAFVKIFNEVYG